MKHRKIATVDQNTGEILHGVIVYCSVKRDPYAKGWIMNSQEALELLAKDRDLTGETLRVLLFLMAYLDFENWIQIPQSKIAKNLGLQKQNVSRAIILLEKKEIVLRGPKIGKSYAFRLNPDFGWKGKVKNLNEYRKEKDNEETRKMLKRRKKTENT